MPNEELLAQLKALEEEFGIQRYTGPDVGVYHVEIAEDTKVGKDWPPRLQLAMSVVCGPHAKTEFSTFFGWLAEEDQSKEKSKEEREKVIQNIFLRNITDIMASEGAVSDSVVNTLRDLKTADDEDVEVVLEELVEHLIGRQVYVSVSKKGDRTNYRFIPAGHKSTNCPCSLSNLPL